ncbi:hypothetical protein FJZ33_00380 [Candidatus Poribacteria bacterium]|nr:hypothetical protein [Candidatus Poribacteria bacterium]
MGKIGRLLHGKLVWVLTLLLLIILLVLSLIRKAAVIDADLTVGKVSFVIDSGDSRGIHKLIDSVGVRSIYLSNCDKVECRPKSLAYNKGEVEMNGAPIEIKPKEEYPTLKLEGRDMALVHFNVSGNPKVTFYKYESENTIDVKVQRNLSDRDSVEKWYGEVSVGDRADVRIEGCVVSKDGEAILKTDNTFLQQTFQAQFSSERIISFFSDSQPVFNIVPVVSEDISGLSSMFNPLQIREIEFDDYINETKISTIEKGIIRFRNLGRNDIGLNQRNFLSISNKQPLMIVGMGLEKQGIKMLLSGRVESLKVGQVEQLPSWLEYLFENHKLRAIIVILIWYCGAVGIPLFRSKGRRQQKNDKTLTFLTLPLTPIFIRVK